MVAYNYQQRFWPKVRDYSKLQTVRAHRKRHARPGERIQNYGGMRTKACVKLIPDPLCIGVEDISIWIGGDEHKPVEGIEINGFELAGKALTQFAVADGFGGYRGDPLMIFGRFWTETHGIGRFDGVVIKWREPLPGEPRCLA
jgi:hypothetical protein